MQIPVLRFAWVPPGIVTRLSLSVAAAGGPRFKRWLPGLDSN